jgi:hypothetical protein
VDPASLKATLGGIQKPISRLCLLPSLQLFLHTQRLLPIYNTNNHFSCQLVSPSRGLPLRKNVSTPGKHPHSISRALYHLAFSISTPYTTFLRRPPLRSHTLSSHHNHIPSLVHENNPMCNCKLIPRRSRTSILDRCDLDFAFAQETRARAISSTPSSCPSLLRYTLLHQRQEQKLHQRGKSRRRNGISFVHLTIPGSLI